MNAPILAAYDPFLEDRAPVELALTIRHLTGASVLAAAVYPAMLIDGFLEPYAIEPETLATGDRALARLREDTGVHTHSVTDISVPRALQELARSEGAGLVIIGSTAHTGAGRVLPGSTAERVLHGAPCPVALAPKGYLRGTLKTVAVGFADTPEGHVALVAAHLLALRAGAKLRAISVLHPSGGLDAALAKGTPPLRGIALEGHHRAEHEAALERAIAALPGGVEVEQETHVDDPADALLRVSRHVDAIVVGSRGYGPVRSVLLGGVSRRLVDGAHCPVIVLPRGVERPLEDLFAVPSAVTAS